MSAGMSGPKLPLWADFSFLIQCFFINFGVAGVFGGMESSMNYPSQHTKSLAHKPSQQVACICFKTLSLRV